MRPMPLARGRWAIHVMAVLFVLGGCAPSLTTSSRQTVVENRPQTTLRLIREFFEENELGRTIVDVHLMDVAMGWELDQSSKMRIVDAIRHGTRPVDTGDWEVVLLASIGFVQLDGPHTSLVILLSDVGFSLGGTTYKYVFTNPALARIVEEIYEKAGPLRGFRDRHLRHCLKVAAGEPSELPEPTDEDRRIEAEQERQRSYCYTMTDEEMAALDEVRAFVEGGGDVNALVLEDPQDAEGGKETRLHRAVKEGFRTVAEWLLLHGANPNVADWVGIRPLDWAARYGRRACVALLILRGADVNSRDVGHQGPLHWTATGYGDRHDPRRVDIAQMLIAAGADVNATERDGSTPLHGATSYGRLEIAALLIGAGADIEPKDKYGRTPLQQGILGFQPEAARLLLRKGARPDLYATGSPFRPEWVGQFLDKYPEVVNARGPEGNRPLHYAAMRGQTDIVPLLLKRGAEMGARNEAGETALDLARRNSHKAIVELLKAHSARE